MYNEAVTVIIEVNERFKDAPSTSLKSKKANLYAPKRMVRNGREPNEP